MEEAICSNLLFCISNEWYDLPLPWVTFRKAELSVLCIYFLCLFSTVHAFKMKGLEPKLAHSVPKMQRLSKQSQGMLVMRSHFCLWTESKWHKGLPSAHVMRDCHLKPGCGKPLSHCAGPGCLTFLVLLSISEFGTVTWLRLLDSESQFVGWWFTMLLKTRRKSFPKLLHFLNLSAGIFL